jgi:REP element-mobilizing transposase RayT
MIIAFIKMVRSLPAQLDLPLRKHGGKRKGAGRKRGHRVRHVRRPNVAATKPLHITLRAARDVPNLRRWHSAAAIGATFKKIAANPLPVRVIQFSIQRDHMHMIVESDGRGSLTSGMRALTIRLAKAVNKRLDRHGKVFGDRYHARPLRTPYEVRKALIYVLHNHKKHGYTHLIDTLSSAPWFDFAEQPARRTDPPPTTEPILWLLTIGWRKHGPISIHDAPRPK